VRCFYHSIFVRSFFGAKNRRYSITVHTGRLFSDHSVGQFGYVAWSLLFFRSDHQHAIAECVSLLGDTGGIGKCVGVNQKCGDNR
jgi:hypothetical protein